MHADTFVERGPRSNPHSEASRTPGVRPRSTLHWHPQTSRGFSIRMSNAHDRPDEKPEAGPPSEERVRLELVLFADLVLRLEKEGRLAEALPFVLERLGDLRRLLFDYEVRGTERLLPIEDPLEREARRIIREVEESRRRMLGEWDDS